MTMTEDHWKMASGRREQNMQWLPWVWPRMVGRWPAAGVSKTFRGRHGYDRRSSEDGQLFKVPKRKEKASSKESKAQKLKNKANKAKMQRNQIPKGQNAHKSRPRRPKCNETRPKKAKTKRKQDPKGKV